MNELISEAASVLVPIASMGAGAAIQAAASETGKDLQEWGRKILVRLRLRGGDQGEAIEGDVTQPQMASALEKATSEGVVSQQDLEHLIRLARLLVPNEGRLTADSIRNAFVGNTFSGPFTIN